MTVTTNNKPYVTTPLVHSSKLSTQAPCKVFLKQEFVQPSGSYKLRGLSHLIETRLASYAKEHQNKPVRVLAASGGNAGNAVSVAAEFHGVRATIVVPKRTSEMMKTKIANNGAELIVAGDNIGAADEYLRDVLIPSIRDECVIYCHPYDLPEIWEGHSTMIDEIVDQLQHSNQLHRLKAVVCSIGGGGLYNGIVRGLKRHDLSTPVITLETDSCPTFQKAIEAGKPVTLKSFRSIAVSLACPYVSQQSMDNYNSHKTMNFLVNDAQAANACIKFCDDYNVIVEPACGVALCSVYEGILEQLKEELLLTKDDIVVVVVCGGSATSFLDLMNYKETYWQ